MGKTFKAFFYAHPFIEQSTFGLFWLYLFFIHRQEGFEKGSPFIPQSFTGYTQKGRGGCGF
jgi:hypothetical protein